MKNKKGIPFVFYFYLHSKLREFSKRERISKKKVRTFLHHWRIPKNMRPVIVKEMELLGLIKEDGRLHYRIKESSSDLFDLNRIYETLGLWEK